MSASIRINGVTQRAAVVPFGASVSLLNAAPTGTSQKWEVLDYPNDLADVGPDFATNWPGWTAAGDGTYFINQSGVYPAVTFKPDVTGTYLIRLSSVETSGTAIQTAVVRVQEVHSGEHLPAARESDESDVRQGYKKALNGRLKRLARRSQGYIRVANTSGSGIARGKVVRLIGTADAHAIPPATNPGGSTAAPEKVFTVQAADNTAVGALNGDYAILDETLANNAVGWAQKYGLFEGKSDVNYTGFTVGNRLYFDNTGTQVNTAPGSGAAVAIGVLLENGATGSLSVALAGVQKASGGATREVDISVNGTITLTTGDARLVAVLDVTAVSAVTLDDGVVDGQELLMLVGDHTGSDTATVSGNFDFAAAVTLTQTEDNYSLVWVGGSIGQWVLVGQQPAATHAYVDNSVAYVAAKQASSVYGSSGGGINPTTEFCARIRTGAVVVPYALADGGTLLPEKLIVCEQHGGGNGVVTVSDGVGFTTLTFSAAGQSAYMQWLPIVSGLKGWILVSTRGAVAA